MASGDINTGNVFNISSTYNKAVDATSAETAKTTQKSAYKYNHSNDNNGTYQDWGSSSARSIFNTFTPLTDKEDGTAKTRNLLTSRLWKGVPQLTDEMLGAFDTAFNGHTFFFVKEVPKFMTTGVYEGTTMHTLMKNLVAVIERACTSFNGPNELSMESASVTDGNMQLNVPTRSMRQTTNINLTVHEFAGLPVKNAIETWITGIYDPISRHASYHGNLGIPGGWCLQNHTMSMLVVKTDPTWTQIDDAAYYSCMYPTAIPSFFDYSKDDSSIISDVNLQFNCIEHRNAAVMKAAEVYMNNRILKFAQTAAFNSRQFVPTKDMTNYAYADSDAKAFATDLNYNLTMDYTNNASNPKTSVRMEHARFTDPKSTVEITRNSEM